MELALSPGSLLHVWRVVVICRGTRRSNYRRNKAEAHVYHHVCVLRCLQSTGRVILHPSDMHNGPMALAGRCLMSPVVCMRILAPHVRSLRVYSSMDVYMGTIRVENLFSLFLVLLIPRPGMHDMSDMSDRSSNICLWGKTQRSHQDSW